MTATATTVTASTTGSTTASTTSGAVVDGVGHWQMRAACREVDPEVFFPVAESGPVFEAQVAIAKSVCAGCPVRVECLADERRALRTTRPATTRRPTAGPRAIVSAAEVLEAGLRRGARPAQVRAAGRLLLAAGRPQQEVAARCGVCLRTVARWATTTTSHTTMPAAAVVAGAGTDRGGSRVRPLISHANPLAGTRAEGHRA